MNGRAVNPHRITVALDRAGLFGPNADAKLGAVEPDLDNWEAGLYEPSPAQLAKLAQLANVPVSFFTLADAEAPALTVARIRYGGRRGCELVVSMHGEPTGAPQPSLFDGAES